MSIEQNKLKRFRVIAAPDKLVIPEHFGITRTERTGHTAAILAASRIEMAKYLNSQGIHYADKRNNPFKS